jgi:hypothetical protein
VARTDSMHAMAEPNLVCDMDFGTLACLSTSGISIRTMFSRFPRRKLALQNQAIVTARALSQGDATQHPYMGILDCEDTETTKLRTAPTPNMRALVIAKSYINDTVAYCKPSSSQLSTSSSAPSLSCPLGAGSLS